MPNTFRTLQCEITGAKARVSLNRPELHNAFNETLLGELTECFKDLSENESVRVIVLEGAGKSFCAGADLTWMGKMAGYSRDENIVDAIILQQMFMAIADCPKVTIARVHGAALGGGAGLVAVCDIAIAAEEVKLGFTEVRLGIAPSVIAPYVVQKIGTGRARALFVTGERITAQEALRIGLVQKAVSGESLDATVEQTVSDVLSSSPKAIAAVKKLLLDIEGITPWEAADTTLNLIADLRVSEEGQEGIKAFLEKRKPDFAG